MRLASTLLIVGLAGCVTGPTGGIPIEYTAVLNSTLFFRAELERIQDSEIIESDIEEVLLAIQSTDAYVERRYSSIATSYLDLVNRVAGEYAFPGDIEEVLETVRLLSQE